MHESWVTNLEDTIRKLEEGLPVFCLPWVALLGILIRTCLVATALERPGY